MLAGRDPGAEFHHLTFQIRGIHLKLPNQFAIDEKRRMRGFGLIRTVTVQHQAKAIFGIYREAVKEMCGRGQT
jgi:hypothetical protein